MTEAIVVGIGTGLLTSGIIAWLFYHFGRRDSEAALRRAILTFVTLRIKQTIPTRRESIPQHYDLRDTAHWLTCLSEVLAEMGFTEDAAVTKECLRLIEQAPATPEPDESQKKQGEADKVTWQKLIHDRIDALK
jgi:hypothetical protein